ncbi:MAG: DUF302 domain-containing protein [Thermaerobacter sp.]|nr:DUF302 domain-containing protein [Thermaerobacter sp.]
MSFAYHKETGKAPAEATAALEAALQSKRFSVLWHLDMSETLEGKGFPGHDETHIFEVCNAARADEALHMAPDIAYLLPCKMLVRATDGGSEIGLLLPSALIGMTGAVPPEQSAFAASVEEDLRAVVDEAAR